MRRIRWIIFASLSLPLFLAAAPTTQPIGPRETVKSFLAAISDGRAKDVTSLCFTSDAQSKTLIADFVQLADAIAVLRHSVGRKFGPPFAEVVLPQMQDPQDVDDAVETIDKNTARLDGGAFAAPMRLVLVDGRWKLDIAALQSNGDFPPDTHAYLSALAKVVRRTAADVDSGKFDSPGLTSEVLQIRQSQINEEAPTTIPSTEPATAPD